MTPGDPLNWIYWHLLSTLLFEFLRFPSVLLNAFKSFYYSRCVTPQNVANTFEKKMLFSIRYSDHNAAGDSKKNGWHIQINFVNAAKLVTVPVMLEFSWAIRNIIRNEKSFHKIINFKNLTFILSCNFT